MVSYKILFFFFFFLRLRHADYETGGSRLDYGNPPNGKLSPQGGFSFFFSEGVGMGNVLGEAVFKQGGSY